VNGSVGGMEDTISVHKTSVRNLNYVGRLVPD
jgi:hypothetical protein